MNQDETKNFTIWLRVKERERGMATIASKHTIVCVCIQIVATYSYLQCVKGVLKTDFENVFNNTSSFSHLYICYLTNNFYPPSLSLTPIPNELRFRKEQLFQSQNFDKEVENDFTNILHDWLSFFIIFFHTCSASNLSRQSRHGFSENHNFVKRDFHRV